MNYNEMRELLINKRRDITAQYICDHKCTIKEAYEQLSKDKDLMKQFEQYHVGFSITTLKRELDLPLKQSNPKLYEQVRPVIDGNRNNVITNKTMSREEFACLVVLKRDVVEGKSFRTILKELDLSEGTVIRMYREYKDQIELTEEDYQKAKESDLQMTPHIQDKVSQVRSGLENRILSLAQYAKQKNCNLQQLSQYFHISETELKMTLIELLPILDPDLYESLKLQLGLENEVQKETEQMHHRK